MPHRRFRVTNESPDKTRLPEWANQYVVAVEWLMSRGLLREIDQQLRISRRDGYTGLDVFLFLLAFHTSSLRCGLKRFYLRSRHYGHQLAAVAGRSRWPSSTAVSRFLNSDGCENFADFSDWLLGRCIEGSELEQHWSVTTRDTYGEAWHFFDWDPTVTTLRHRALPSGADLPEPQRRSEGIAAPGYPGRKRGDVQFSRALLQHAGTGLWLGLWLGPGNGKSREDIYNGVTCVRHWCERTENRPQRTVFRSDGGAGGNVPAISLMQKAGIPYLTRIARYEILDWPETKAVLECGVWQEVGDSGSGPQRQALELGMVRLSAAAQTQDAEGNRYKDIETRVVVSRFRNDGKKRGAGIVIDGWQYELYATCLPASCWPASETVTAYYGRVGQENRFYQEDCELGLDRIFSYNPWGQRLANLVGLFVWNWRIVRGYEFVAPLPTTPTRPPPRQNKNTEPDASSAATTDSEPMCMPETDTQTPEDVASPSSGPDESTPEKASNGYTAFTTTDSLASKAEQLALLGTANWEVQLRNTPQWHWDPNEGLVCPGNAVMRLHELRSQRNGDVRVVLRARISACQTCSLRSSCTTSTSAQFKKERGFTIRPGDVEDIERLQACVASVNDVVVQRKPRPYVPRKRQPEPPRWWPMTETQYGPHQALGPSLVPAALKKIFTVACDEAEIRVSVDGLTRRQRPKPPSHFAPTAAIRQQRRKTWKWRSNRNALPSSATVDIKLCGASQLLAILLSNTDETTRNAA